MQFPYEIGKRLVLELKCGQIYEGTAILSTTSRIDLCDIIDYPGRRKIPADRSFFKMELSTIATLYDKLPDPNGLKERIIAMPSEELEQLMNVAENYVYLPVIDRNYLSAIEELNDSETIGVAGLWDNFGRFRAITLLVLATIQKVYIFDLQFYGRKQFPEELKKILESTIQKKVLHGAQKISDSLFHCNQVRINYVCDTQVWDYSIIWKLKKERLEKFRSLSECLTHYFNLPSMVDDVMQEDEEEWKKRPLSDEKKFQASRLAAYLIVLNQKQEWILEKDVSKFTKDYMNGNLDVTPLESPLL